MTGYKGLYPHLFNVKMIYKTQLSKFLYIENLIKIEEEYIKQTLFRGYFGMIVKRKFLETLIRLIYFVKRRKKGGII